MSTSDPDDDVRRRARSFARCVRRFFLGGRAASDEPPSVPPPPCAAELLPDAPRAGPGEWGQKTTRGRKGRIVRVATAAMEAERAVATQWHRRRRLGDGQREKQEERPGRAVPNAPSDSSPPPPPPPAPRSRRHPSPPAEPDARSGASSSPPTNGTITSPGRKGVGGGRGQEVSSTREDRSIHDDARSSPEDTSIGSSSAGGSTSTGGRPCSAAEVHTGGGWRRSRRGGGREA